MRFAQNVAFSCHQMIEALPDFEIYGAADASITLSISRVEPT
jgi:hypothetical protein